AAEVVERGAHGAPRRAVLLARGREGYASLCRVLTDRHLDPSFTLTRSVRARPGGLTLLSEDAAVLVELRDAVPVYAELVPGRGERPLRQWARAEGIPCAATNDVHFVHPEGHRLHQVLRAIDRNTTLDRVPREDLAEAGRFFLSEAEMAARLPHAPESIENAARLADEHAIDWEMGRPVFPSYPIDRGDAFDLLRARCEAG